MTRVLVVGAPRSGTTWVAQVLCAASGASYVEEPDNHFRFAFAYRAKRQLGRGAYPQVTEDESDVVETEFGALWRRAFAAGRRSAFQTLSRRVSNRLVTFAGPRRAADMLVGPSRDARLNVAERLAVPEQAREPSAMVVVKSVYAPLCAEWLASRYATGTVVVVRSPLEIVASWVTLGWLGSGWPDPLSSVPLSVIDALTSRHAVPPPPPSRLGRAAWLIGMLQRALEDSARRNPAWCRADHEELYTSPLEEFPRLAAAVGLPWSEAGDRLIEQGNRPGKGYEITRSAAQLQNAWRTRLSDEQAREVRDVLDRFPSRAI